MLSAPTLLSDLDAGSVQSIRTKLGISVARARASERSCVVAPMVRDSGQCFLLDMVRLWYPLSNHSRCPQQVYLRDGQPYGDGTAPRSNHAEPFRDEHGGSGDSRIIPTKDAANDDGC